MVLSATLMGNDLIERRSIYSDQYHCTIEKVEFLPGIIRVFIDERGDNSLGPLQDPMSSRMVIRTGHFLSESKNPINGRFSVSDESRQYLGYLDFPLDNSLFNGEHIIGFQYGSGGYSTATLFRFNHELTDKYYIKPT